MQDANLVKELSMRTNVEAAEAQPVLDFIASWREDPKEVDDLIERARAHPLGLDFLVEGYLGSVAVSFQTHAFTVEAARNRLGRSGQL